MAPKILIVDDDPATRSGLRQFFQQARFEVVAVASYAEGRFALAHLQPDVLITDVRLGEYNGLQLVAVRPGSIPTIVVTAYPDPVLEADARSLGADYLVKPVSPVDLMALVQEKLERRDEGTSISRRPRRWERKPVTADLAARIGDRPARIIDVSYGGLRLAMERPAGRSIPSSLTLEFPATGLSVPVDVVWTARAGEALVCGASVVPREDATSRAWHGLVDAIG